MIQSNELRTGSYILVDNEIKRVCCIKNEDDNADTTFIGFGHNNSCEYENASSERLAAVPLTDDLLTRLGFTFHNYHNVWQHAKPQRTATVDITRGYGAVDFVRHELIKNVQYLHLLQNLIFSIQKEELQFVS